MLMYMHNRKPQIIIGVIVSFFLSIMAVDSVSAELNDDFFMSHCYAEDIMRKDNGHKAVVTYACSNYENLRMCIRSSGKYYMINIDDVCTPSDASNAVIATPAADTFFQDPTFKDYFYCKAVYTSPEGYPDYSEAPLVNIYHSYSGADLLDCSSSYFLIPTVTYSEDDPPHERTVFFNPAISKSPEWFNDGTDNGACGAPITYDLLHYPPEGVTADIYDCRLTTDGDKMVSYKHVFCLVADIKGEDLIECTTELDEIYDFVLNDSRLTETWEPDGLDMKCEDRSSLGWAICGGSDLVSNIVDLLVNEFLLPMLQWRVMLE